MDPGVLDADSLDTACVQFDEPFEFESFEAAEGIMLAIEACDVEFDNLTDAHDSELGHDVDGYDAGEPDVGPDDIL